MLTPRRVSYAVLVFNRSCRRGEPGIPGMVLAPVILNYLRVEMSKIEVQPEP